MRTYDLFFEAIALFLRTEATLVTQAGHLSVPSKISRCHLKSAVTSAFLQQQVVG